MIKKISIDTYLTEEKFVIKFFKRKKRYNLLRLRRSFLLYRFKPDKKIIFLPFFIGGFKKNEKGNVLKGLVILNPIVIVILSFFSFMVTWSIL